MPPSEIPLTFVTFRKSISYLELIGVKLLNQESRHDEKYFNLETLPEAQRTQGIDYIT